MITARKSFWFESLFAVYNKNLIKRRFQSVEVTGFSKIKNRSAASPLLFYANHSSWWDGLIAFELSRQAKLRNYTMMEEKQLKKLFLFRKLGAFSVNKNNLREAVKSVNYAAELLKTDRRAALWIFPQGEILPNDIRPIRFYNGFSRIIEKVKIVDSVAVALRYEFLGDWKPRVFVRFGEIETYNLSGRFDSKKNTRKITDNLIENLDELKRQINRRDFKGFEKLI